MLRFSLRQNVIACYLLALVVCAMGWLAYRGAGGEVAARDDAVRTQELLTAASAVGSTVRAAESLQRGFLLTGDPRFLGGYRSAAEGAAEALTHLRGEMLDNPALDARVDSLGYFVRLELAELAQTARLQRDGGTQAALAVMRSSRGAESLPEIERLLASLTDAATRTSAGDRAQSAAEAQLVGLGAVAAGLAALLLALLVHALHVRNVREQERVTEELENQSYQLQIQATELQTTNAELESATRELVEQAIESERSETLLAGILGSATDAVVSFDDEQRLVYSNAAAERLFGVEHGEVTDARITDFLAPRSVDGFEERALAARRASHSGERSPELWDAIVVRRDGISVPVELSMAYTRTRRQGLFTAVLRDVSQQRQLEEEFRQAQKMEAVGRLAGGIAHDFNNLLTVIGASSDFLLYDLKADSAELTRDITEIKRATDRAASLTRQLLAFSRRQLVQPQVLDINIVVSEMESMLRRLIGEDVTLVTDYDEGVGMIRVDRGQLEQIVVNLVVNARDAMPGGGIVNLRTGGGCGIPDNDGSVGTRAASTRFVTLSVTDSGVGMDEETRAHIFEPFFTTKEQGRGTGLGLSTVYGIVKQAGGDVAVTSELEVGTEFTLYFPCVDEEEVPAATQSPAFVTLRGTETVLVVEDEEALRRLTRRILESRGYAVLDAPDGDAAIKLMATTHQRIDLVLTDVVMPGMSGRELVERLLPVYPWLRVLFMSGYTEDTMLQHRVAELGITVLEKPFRPDDLALAVRSTLDRAPEPVGATMPVH